MITGQSFTKTSHRLQETVSFLRKQAVAKPRFGIVLGSGLGAFVNDIQVECTLPFSEIPHFLPTTVEGHSGNLIFGTLGRHSLVVLQGRNHYYEGHGMDSVVFPTRVMALLGIESLVLTNSAGGMGDGMQTGDFMILDDHINLSGTNPLIGPNISEFGPRFPDLSRAYDQQLSDVMAGILTKNKVRFHRGVYAGMTGPTYETPAEVRFLKMIGCSAVGMSTVAECIAANHMGVRVMAMSCISNLAAGLSPHKLTHAEVTETGQKVASQFSTALKDFFLALT